METPKLFTLIRHADDTGVSGIGRVLDGVVFHTGQVVICWRSDTDSTHPGHSSIAIYPSWEAFMQIHVGAHPNEEPEIIFGDALLISQEDAAGSPRRLVPQDDN